jgi:hypothetical protein
MRHGIMRMLDSESAPLRLTATAMIIGSALPDGATTTQRYAANTRCVRFTAAAWPSIRR